MAGFALPADFRTESLAAIFEANPRLELPVREVFGNLNPSPYGSGRAGSFLPAVTPRQLGEYVASAAHAGIEFNYTLNFSSLANREYMPEHRVALRRFLEDMIRCGFHIFATSGWGTTKNAGW